MQLNRSGWSSLFLVARAFAKEFVSFRMVDIGIEKRMGIISPAAWACVPSPQRIFLDRQSERTRYSAVLQQLLLLKAQLLGDSWFCQDSILPRSRGRTSHGAEEDYIPQLPTLEA